MAAPRELGTGLLFLGIAAAGLFFGDPLEVGSADMMGPGYVPIAVSFGLLALGAIMMVRGMIAAGPPITAVRARPVLLITAAVAAFALTVVPLGFLVALVLLIGVSSLAYSGVRLHETALLTLFLALLAVGVFVWGLGIQVKIAPF
jgi:hypothetical protein